MNFDDSLFTSKKYSFFLQQKNHLISAWLQIHPAEIRQIQD